MNYESRLRGFVIMGAFQIVAVQFDFIVIFFVKTICEDCYKPLVSDVQNPYSLIQLIYNLIKNLHIPVMRPPIFTKNVRTFMPKVRTFMPKVRTFSSNRFLLLLF
jgi:hypothetical protein